MPVAALYPIRTRYLGLKLLIIDWTGVVAFVLLMRQSDGIRPEFRLDRRWNCRVVVFLCRRVCASRCSGIREPADGLFVYGRLQSFSDDSDVCRHTAELATCRSTADGLQRGHRHLSFVGGDLGACTYVHSVGLRSGLSVGDALDTVGTRRARTGSR